MGIPQQRSKIANTATQAQGAGKEARVGYVNEGKGAGGGAEDVTEVQAAEVDAGMVETGAKVGELLDELGPVEDGGLIVVHKLANGAALDEGIRDGALAPGKSIAAGDANAGDAAMLDSTGGANEADLLKGAFPSEQALGTKKLENQAVGEKKDLWTVLVLSEHLCREDELAPGLGS